MQVYLGTTNKKRNSTLQPTLTKKLNCILKEGTSLVNPTLIFDRKAVGHTYNYAYIPDFGRYYFVGDPVYDNARIEYPCRCDVLASFKTEIGSSSHYVLRSASESNGYIIDTRYPPSMENADTSFVNFTPSGTYGWSKPPQCYCVGIAGLGGISYYYMNPAYFTGFFDKLFDPQFADDYLGIWGTLNPNLKALIDPLQYISCVWGFPFAYSSASGDSVSTIPVGPLNIQVTDSGGNPLSAKKASSNLQFFVETPIGSAATALNPCVIPKPSHPQKARGEYMHSSAYTICSMLTPFGEYQLDASVIAQSTSTRLWARFYAPTGDLHIQVIAYMGADLVLDNSIVLLDIVGKAGINVPVSQIVARGGYSGIFSAMSNLSNIAGLATGNIPGTVINTIMGGIGQIGSAAEAAIPKTTITGSQGSAANNDRGFCVTYQYYLAVDDDVTDHGQPLCEVRTLNTLSGFILCQAESVEITGTDQEANEVLNYLNTGFFYE